MDKRVSSHLEKMSSEFRAEKRPERVEKSNLALWSRYSYANSEIVSIVAHDRSRCQKFGFRNRWFKKKMQPCPWDTSEVLSNKRLNSKIAIGRYLPTSFENFAVI